MPASGTEPPDKGERPDDPVSAAIRAVRLCQTILDQQIQQAVTWMQVMPALPGYEALQAAGHLANLLELLNSPTRSAPSPSAIDLERARAEKHYGLATADATASLGKFLLAATSWTLNELQKQQQTVINYYLGELDHLRNSYAQIPEPPSQPRQTLTETEDDRDQIREIALKLQELAEKNENIFAALQQKFGANIIKELLDAFRRQAGEGSVK